LNLRNYKILHTNNLELAITAKDNGLFVKLNNDWDWFNNTNNKQYESFMITYVKNSLRLENYYNLNKIFDNTLQMYEAYDSIKCYEYYKKYAQVNKYVTKNFINLSDKTNGKLGCNLSHQKILEMIKDNNYFGKEWFLIMEDDITVDSDFPLFISKILKEVKQNNIDTDYIQLWSNDRHVEWINDSFKNKQLNQENHIIGNIYRMIFQWGAVCFLISREGIEFILNNYPIDIYMDIFYSRNINNLKSIYYLNDKVKTEGAYDEDDKTSKLGSIVWDF
jgi:GR25 family glycosyltransferase involved in LPS biosynthesis